LYEIEGTGEITVLRGHSDLPFCVTFSPDSKLIASGGMDYTIKLWCAQSKTILTTLKRHTNWVRAIVFSPNSKLLVSCGYDNTINVWDVQDNLKQKAP
jgi:WD40 repeat protein